jgi:PAS domain S-box-containing protein
MAAVAASYLATGAAGLSIPSIGRSVTLVWPPTGIAVAALFRGGLRFWPGVFLGAFLTNLLVAASAWPVAAGIATGNTLGPVLAAALLRRGGFSPRFDHRHDILLFATRPLLGMALTATNGTAWLTAAGVVPAEQFLDAWLTWWLGDVAGVLIVSPVLLALGPDAVRVRPAARAVELAVLLAAVFALGVLGFDPLGFGLPQLPVSFLPLVGLVWVGLRYRVWAAAVAVLVLSATAVLGTARGNGPFAGEDEEQTRLLLLWGYVTAAAVVTQVIGALLAEQTRAETALAATAAEYRAALDDAPALICRYTPDGMLTFANEPLCRFLGRSREQVLGKSVLDFLPILPTPDRPAEQSLVPPGDPVLSRLGPLVRADGAERWHRWTARPIPGPAGQVREYHAVGVDVTERRRADEERQALERKVLEAQRLESLGVLAGGIAHDFSNLLAGVLGHAELAAAALPTDSPARGHLDAALAGVKQAGGLTRQLLAYSGKGKFVVRPVDLADLVRQTAGLLRAVVARHTELRIELADDLPPVVADPTPLRQVVVNLVTNATEALADSPGTILVSAAAADLTRSELPESYLFDPLDPGRYVILTVADTGCGMDEPTRSRVFDPFFTTKFAGRGLGMAAVLGIVRGHSGGIRVDTRPGTGTTITVYLPASEGMGEPETRNPKLETNPDQMETTRSEPKSGAEPPLSLISDSESGIDSDFELRASDFQGAAGGRPLVMVIDDEDAVRRVAQLMLEQLGFAVIPVEDGSKAVELFARKLGAIRAVVVDLTMPRMGGAEVVAALRRLSPSVPVILCSGYTADVVPEALARAGLSGFLQKPFTLAELGQVVRAAIGTG